MILAIASCARAQLAIQYLPCNPCTGNELPQTFRVNSTTTDVNSDFGKRNCLNATAWHRGIDLNLAGISDLGYPLLAPVSGRISKLVADGEGYVYLIIDGPGNQNIGFGHLFQNGSLPRLLNDFALVSTGTGHLAIINLKTHQAISTANNVQLSYNGLTYITSNQVQAGQAIAPLGNSNGDAAPHVHVYHPLNPDENPQEVPNAKDPLEILTHYNTQYEATIPHTHRITQPGSNTCYAGDETSAVEVCMTMLNPGTLGTAPDQYYQTAVMDLDDVALYIRKDGSVAGPASSWGSPGAAFQLIKGPYYESRICHGARGNTTMYPANLSDNNFGSNTHTGILPRAYNNAPADHFFFADILTRIHKNDVPGSPVSLAMIIDDARYPDGIWHLGVKAVRVNGTQLNNASPGVPSIIIDNFRPYIKKVKVAPSGSSGFYYEGKLDWNGTHLIFSKILNGNITVGESVTVRIFTSEPMQEVSLSTDNWQGSSTSPVGNSERKEWQFQIPSGTLGPGTTILRITGKDMSGNPVEGFITVEPKSAGSFPVRTGEISWAPAPEAQTDIVHQLEIVAPQPPQAGFIPNQTVINSGDCVAFFDASSGNPTSWSWSFPGGNPPVSDVQHPVIQYFNLGTWSVTLSVQNAYGNSTVYGTVTVTDQMLPPSAGFSPGNITLTAGSEVHFVDLSTGSPDYWNWDFDGAAPPSSIQHPVVTFSQTGTYQVTLYVSNAMGSSVESATVTVVDNSNLLDVMCYANPFLGTPGVAVNLMGAVFNGIPPYTFTFDFADGFISTMVSNMPSESVTHHYTSDGTYDPRVTVVDGSGMTGYCDETVTITGGNPCESLQADFSMDPQTGSLVCPVNTPVSFIDQSTGGSPPYFYHWTFSADPLTGAQPNLQEAYSQGPHELWFTVPGNYPVSLHICDQSGCGRTISRSVTVYQPQHCLVAKINKMINGKVVLSTGQHRFYDHTFIPWCTACSDPPGTSLFPCETNNGWKLYSWPDNQLIMSKNGKPYADTTCNLLSALDREFGFNFTDKGYYRLHFKAWDKTCNVITGFDCQDETNLLVRIVDCNEYIDISESGIEFQSGYNEDIIGGFIISGSGGAPLLIPPDVEIAFLAVGEVHLTDGFQAEEACSFRAAITDCPGFQQPSMSELQPVPAELVSDWEVFPNPARDRVTVRFEQDLPDYSLRIYNLLGEALIGANSMSGRTQTFDTGKLPAGIYLVRFVCGGISKVKRLVLIR
ncbi:MAG TPA: PKD domain-containing protein [Bacteroidales bacterium]|nr:PKD domain-containing protein [Bacteroidales bacterium]HSA44080.1 PKD domain-containing protein [Bacteroidales bacterium]